MEFWLLRWLRRPGKWWYALAPASLLVLGGVAILVRILFPAAGDVASVASLIIGLPGLVLTIWAVLETQRIERESKRELQQAVQAGEKRIAATQAEMQRQLEVARQETRDALSKVKTALYLIDCREAYDLAKTARNAIRARQWKDAREMCEAMRRACLLIIHCGLAAADVEQLEEKLENLTAVLATLRQYESDPPKVADLAGKLSQWDSLEDIKFVLETINARNRSQVLELPHAGNSPN
jgi:hypothetical protein